jgi:epoxyqueuosine reductase
MNRRGLALEIATELGFDLVGVAPLTPPPAASRFEEWLGKGHHGSMAYLEAFRERIVDPQKVLSGGRSLLVVGLGHSRPQVDLETQAGPARVARYAGGRDYHNLLGKRLKKLARRLEAEGFAGPWRQIVDAGPLLERSHAQVAGLGFESKAANLLAPTLGPWFFLGELLLGEELEPTGGPAPGSCGTCRACIDACPTEALLEPGVLDARRCISYLTIEHRGPVDPDLRSDLGPWVFGCDVCSEVCPHGAHAPDLSERFGKPSALADSTGLVESWLAPEYNPKAELRGSPLQRPRREGLARNAALFYGNQPADAAQPLLERALEDGSPVVREAAAWALCRSYAGAGTRLLVERAHARETDPEARAALERDLAGS